MSESSPPPPPASARGQLRRAAEVSRFVAAILILCISVRFALASVRHALGVSRATFAETPAPHPASDPHSSASGKAVSGAASPPVPGSLPSGRPLRMTLGVSVGSPRSEVYVNGSLVGQTPFLGDTSCKSGQSVRIEVVPDKGPPLTYLRECLGGSVDIKGPPP